MFEHDRAYTPCFRDAGPSPQPRDVRERRRSTSTRDGGCRPWWTRSVGAPCKLCAFRELNEWHQLCSNSSRHPERRERLAPGNLERTSQGACRPDHTSRECDAGPGRRCGCQRAAMKCPRGVQTIAATPGVFSKREDTMAENSPGPARRPSPSPDLTPDPSPRLSRPGARMTRSWRAGGQTPSRMKSGSRRSTPSGRT